MNYLIYWALLLGWRGNILVAPAHWIFNNKFAR